MIDFQHLIAVPPNARTAGDAVRVTQIIRTVNNAVQSSSGPFSQACELAVPGSHFYYALKKATSSGIAAIDRHRSAAGPPNFSEKAEMISRDATRRSPRRSTPT